jgi:hypothetical protein
MGFIVQVDGVVKPINKIRAVLVQKIRDIERPFLKVRGGQKRV